MRSTNEATKLNWETKFFKVKQKRKRKTAKN